MATSFMTYVFEKGQSCEKTTSEPVFGQVNGKIPLWLEGTLICNGPGIYNVGKHRYNHAFDGLSVLHRYHIKDGQVTYTSRALDSDTYKKNMKAERIVVHEFGTACFPDPCQTFVEKLNARFSIFTALDEGVTDNCNVSVGYFGDQLYAMTETNLLRRINPEDLKTIGEKTRICDYVALNQATAHPHILEDGSVLNMGNNYRHKKGPHYCIFLVPPSYNNEPTTHCNDKSDNKTSGKRSSLKTKTKPKPESCFTNTKLIAEIPCSSWRYPSYYHSFGITQNYVIFIESPLRIDIIQAVKSRVVGQPFSSALTWDASLKTKFHVVSRKDGKLHPITYESDPFFTLHHVNAYEEDGKIVLDVAGYNTGKVLIKMLQSTYHKSIVNEGGVRRFYLPLDAESKQEQSTCKRSAKVKENPTIFCKPQFLTKDWMDFPRINYKLNGKKYNFFYAMALCTVVRPNSDIPRQVHAIAKVDIAHKEEKRWSEVGKIPSEPIFVANPQKANPDEDDGVVLVTLLHKNEGPTVTLLILDAKSLEEVARVNFQTAGTFTGTFHGQWAQEGNKVHFY